MNTSVATLPVQPVNAGSRMNALGKVLLLQKREYDEAETIRRIECVTMEDIEKILPACLDPQNACTALVGRVNRQKAALLKKLG